MKKLMCAVKSAAGKKAAVLKKAAAGVALTVASGAASAAIDTAPITTKIAEGETAVAAIGGAGLLILAGVALFRYVRRAF